ncbi:MAG: hypothetical protein R3C14_41080 [Caldilineaceae bacterium]
MAALLTLAGYFGPWVPHRVAGLVITGLDLGEYVKFLPVVRSGQVMLWREAFYLPLVTVSLLLSMSAFRARLRYGWLLRMLLLGLAVVAALNLLPPAWSAATFHNPEFHQQVIALAVCLAAVVISPFLALLPRGPIAALLLALSLGALWFPLRDFYQVHPAIVELYNHALPLGWGVYVMSLGLLLVAVIQWLELKENFDASRGNKRPAPHAGERNRLDG